MKLNLKRIENCDGFEYYFDGECYTLEYTSLDSTNSIVGLAKCYEDGTSIYISQMEILFTHQSNGLGRIFVDLLKEHFDGFDELYGIATISSYLFWEAMGCKWCNSDRFEPELEDNNVFSIKLK